MQFRLTLGLILTVLELGVVVFAFVDAAVRRAPLFPAAGKLTKPIWLGILGVSLAFMLYLFEATNLLSLAGTVAGIVYLVDVRPALREVSGGGGNGPYG